MRDLDGMAFSMSFGVCCFERNWHYSISTDSWMTFGKGRQKCILDAALVEPDESMTACE
jgi:hypothetical protein